MTVPQLITIGLWQECKVVSLLSERCGWPLQRLPISAAVLLFTNTLTYGSSSHCIGFEVML